MGLFTGRLGYYWAKWLMRGGEASRMVLKDKQELHRPAPINLKPADNHLFSSEYVKTIPPKVIYKLTKAIFTDEGFVFCNGQIISESAQGTKRTDLLWVCTSTKPTVKADKEKYVIIHGRWTFGYYHWLSETVPKLVYLSQNYDISDLVLLLPKSNDTSFARQFLSDYKFKNVRFVDDNSNVLLDDVIYIPNLDPGGNMSADTAATVFEKYVKAPLPVRNRTIYVSRAKAPVRKIVNEDELIEEMLQLGVEVVYTDDMSIMDQIAMFAACKTLISLHGAALTNMLFMQPGGNVVELRMRDDAYNNCYFSLASAKQQNYYYLLCDNDGTSKSTQLTNFIVDKNELVSLIKSISGSTTT